jgi:hypothetical protein
MLATTGGLRPPMVTGGIMVMSMGFGIVTKLNSFRKENKKDIGQWYSKRGKGLIMRLQAKTITIMRIPAKPQIMELGGLTTHLTEY